MDSGLRRAVARMYRPRLLKLIDPGAHRFAKRALSRLQGGGALHRAALFFGSDMTVVLPEIVSETIYTYGFFDAEVSYMFVAVIEPGQTVLDVGAHFGYFSLLAAALVGDRGSVHAFEPTPSTFAITQENLRGRPNARVTNAGVGDAAKRLQFLDFGLRYSAFNSFASDLRDPTLVETARPNRVEVPIVTLDDYVSSNALRPDFIKVDAENFEAQVMAGARETLRRFGPKVLLETGSEGSRVAAEELVAAGYTAYVCPEVGRIEAVKGTLAEANTRFKDILFSRQRVEAASKG